MVLGVIFLVILTILMPPLGVFLVAGFGADLLINIALTLLGAIPGHIHAFWLLHVYYSRREAAREGFVALPPAAGIYSDNVQSGGHGGYGTMESGAA